MLFHSVTCHLGVSHSVLHTPLGRNKLQTITIHNLHMLYYLFGTCFLHQTKLKWCDYPPPNGYEIKFINFLLFLYI